MTEVKCFPLAGVQNYTVEDFQYYLGLRTQGVFYPDDNLKTEAKSPADMSVTVSAGLAWLKSGDLRGVSFPLPVAHELTCDSADGSQARIDTVVVGLDIAGRTGYIKIVKGLLGGGATAPVRDSSYYELVLAEISIPASSTEISSAQITDKRSDASVCGIISESGVQVINNLTTNSSETALSAAMGKQLQDEKAPKASPTLTGTATIAAANVSGFTQLGTGAPKVKHKKLTGTTAATPTGSALVDHGVDWTKILAVNVIIRKTIQGVVLKQYSYDSDAFAVDFNSTQVQVTLSNSAYLVNLPFTALITYEE
jgi:hypothetical protein